MTLKSQFGQFGQFKVIPASSLGWKTVLVALPCTTLYAMHCVALYREN